ncbi:hypothetical protein BDZ97DRAFT_1914201 [Flammula alnicola]|nr:hypothetical protein BDZ97DRAFT_1914201 [Flammula alnicola]
MTDNTPRHMQSNVLNNLVESNVGSSRNAIKVDLVGKIVYDDPAVFRRLRVDEVDNNFVTTCAKSFKPANAEDINLLKALTKQASKKTPELLELEETNDKASDPNKEERSGNHGSAEEKKMYDPLVRLFNHITTFGQVTASRRFQRTRGMLKADEPHTFGFPSCSPDITITTSNPHGVDPSKSKLWRHRDGFGEVKPSKKQGPKPAIAGKIPPLLTQAADYARLFMSARPFMLFCVGILIFGTEFCVGIFDRDGITLSPIYDMFDNTEIFIRVVRSMACHLTINELGLDPTVRVLTDLETQNLTKSRQKYPSAVMTSVGNDPRRWCTIGPPIWMSLSFLGRGTNVWRVREYVEDVNQQPFLGRDEMILKTAWRSSSRTPESDIYMSITAPPEGLAKFECGGDVKFAGYPITVQNLRSYPVRNFLPKDDIDPPTPVLHRLVLRTVGRPMWEYKSDRDLLTGFRDALQAHKALCAQGILHRDISAGNVLLTKTENPTLRGFITDLEFARIDSPTLSKPQVTTTNTVGPVNRYGDRGNVLFRTQPTTRTHITFESTVTVKRGAGITGTAQFMARDILLQEISTTTERVVHKPGHDVESFIWVLSYCVMRNLYHRASEGSAPKEVHDQSPALRSVFRNVFSQTTTKTIAEVRQSGSSGLLFPRDRDVKDIVAKFMSNALVTLFKDLGGLLYIAANPFTSTSLTHDTLLEVVDKAIASLP